jgi:hypothetical protein
MFEEKFLWARVIICVLDSPQCFKRRLSCVPGIPHWLEKFLRGYIMIWAVTTCVPTFWPENLKERERHFEKLTVLPITELVKNFPPSV